MDTFQVNSDQITVVIVEKSDRACSSFHPDSDHDSDLAFEESPVEEVNENKDD